MRNPFNIALSIKNLALINFSILCFFSFFGTGLPWQVKPEDYFEVESTNVINQILYIYLFFSSMLLVITRTGNILNFMQKEKYLTIFISLCLISFIWSDYSFNSFKRSFQLFTMYLVVVISFIYADQKNLIKILRFLVILYIIVTLSSIILFKEAIDPKFNSWRGIHDQKNGLSQVGIYCFLLSLLFYETWDDRYNKLRNVVISIISILFVFMAGSSNSIIVIFILLSTIFIFKMEKMSQALKIGRTFLFVIFLFVASVFILLFAYSSELLAFIPALFGKDLTLTGRTLFWDNLLLRVWEKPFLGYGYGTFWVMGTARLTELFFEVEWEFNSAHNGFIDIALQLGLTGIVLLFLLLGSFFRKAFNQHENITILFLIYLLIGNLTESTLFLPRGIHTLMFIFFYIRTLQNYILAVRT